MHVRREGLFAALLLTAVGGAATAQVPQAPAVAPPGTPAPVSVSPRPTGIDRLTRLAVPADPAELSPPDPVPPVPATHGPRDGGGSPVGPTQEERKYTLTAGWLDGLRFHTRDDAFHVHVGGNVQVDSTWLIGPKAAFALPGGAANGIGNASATFVRRARLRLEGDIWDQVDYIIEYDFANASNDTGGAQPPSFGNIAGAPAPINIWMQVRDVPFFGNVRFGNQVKPIGFSNQVYQGFLPFLERADNWDAFQGTFDNGFAIGLTARNHSDNELVTWQYGIYRPLVNNFAVALNKVQWGGRVTALPVYEDDGRTLVHVGFGTLNGERPQDELKVRARPLLRNGPGYAVPVLVDTGEVPGSRTYILAPELAAVFGSWTFQAEWTGQFLTQAGAPNGQNQGTVLFHGGYAEVLYFLTGEYQSYDKAAGAFGRVVPNRNLRIKRGCGVEGCGAWQVGVRFSYLDLNDKDIRGGRLYDWTAGVNWFLNPNMKVQLNAILERRDQPGVDPAWISGVGVRGAYDF